MTKWLIGALLAVIGIGAIASANAGSRTCYTNCFGNTCTTTCY